MNLVAMGSDHCPIVVNIDYKDKKGGWKFKFEATWLMMEDCKKVIKEGWSKKVGGLNVEKGGKKARYM